MSYPSRIVCLTEESVETLFLLGEQHRIAGVSVYVKRPEEAQKLTKVSHFTSAKIDKILALKPDLVLGYSDIQKDIAQALIGAGVDVWIANHRSLEGILDYILKLGGMVGVQEKAVQLRSQLESKIAEVRRAVENWKSSYRNRASIKVYFEEWDEPKISAIQWVSELIRICGGEDIFAAEIYGPKIYGQGTESNEGRNTPEAGSLASQRFVQDNAIIAKNPDIIFGCWCGKKVRVQEIKNREGWSKISAIKNNQVYELGPEIFLQPGPAPILEGLDIIKTYIQDLELHHKN